MESDECDRQQPASQPSSARIKTSQTESNISLQIGLNKDKAKELRTRS